jgi:hypothetical protein
MRAGVGDDHCTGASAETAPIGVRVLPDPKSLPAILLHVHKGERI